MIRGCFHNSHHQHTFSIFFVKLTFFCVWSLIKSSSVISKLLLTIILNMVACYYDLGVVVWCGLVWSGVGWYGLMWVGVGWCGLVWVGVGWRGLVWPGVSRCDLVWVGVAWCVKRYSRKDSDIL